MRTFHAQYGESNVQPIPSSHPLEQGSPSVSRPQAAPSFIDVQGIAQALHTLPPGARPRSSPVQAPLQTGYVTPVVSGQAAPLANRPGFASQPTSGYASQPTPGYVPQPQPGYYPPPVSSSYPAQPMTSHLHQSSYNLPMPSQPLYHTHLGFPRIAYSG